MRKNLFAALTALALGLVCNQAGADIVKLPASFKVQDIATNGAVIHVRTGGKGPAVVLLHGYADTGDMWGALAIELASRYTVVIPDLRGLGLSTASGGFDKKTQAADVAGVLDALKIDKTAVVAHDIGNMVAFAFVEQYSDRVTKAAFLDAPIPGVGPWDDILKTPILWHFRFGGPDMERLVAGRERIYLDRFWNDFAADPKKIDEATRSHYAKLYARPGVMHNGFAQFAAFDQDAKDNREFLAKGKLTLPILAIGGAKSFGPTQAVVMRAAADNVQEVVIPDSGHWLMEEQPAATVKAIRQFLDATS